MINLPFNEVCTVHYYSFHLQTGAWLLLPDYDCIIQQMCCNAKICSWHWLYKLFVVASFLFRKAINQWLNVAVKTGSIAYDRKLQIIAHPQPSCKSACAVYVVEISNGDFLLMRTLTRFLACSISLYPYKVKTKWEHFLTLSHKQL